jgi:hypothetical protein
MQKPLHRVGVDSPRTTIPNAGRKELNEPLTSLLASRINQYRQPDGLSHQIRIALQFSIVHTARWSRISKFAPPNHATLLTFQKGHFATYSPMPDKFRKGERT